MATPDSQETTVEITVNPKEYTEGNPAAEEVCALYAADLMDIIGKLGHGDVQVDIAKLLISARFIGSAKYLPHVDIGGLMDGEGDTLEIVLADGDKHYLGYYRYGVDSVKINGEEKKAFNLDAEFISLQEMGSFLGSQYPNLKFSVGDDGLDDNLYCHGFKAIFPIATLGPNRGEIIKPKWRDVLAKMNTESILEDLKRLWEASSVQYS